MHQSLHSVPTPRTPKAKNISHYYGDIVRRLFLAAGVTMLISLPFLWSIASVLMLLGAIGIVVLVIIAGVTTPKKIYTSYLNAAVSGLAFVVFEFAAITTYNSTSVSLTHAVLFVLSQVLAVIFFFALYYASKTLRAFLLHEQKIEVEEVDDHEPY